MFGIGHATLEMCSTLSVVQSFHLLSLCPPLPTDNAYALHCVSNCSPVVQFLRVASCCSPTLLTPEVPQPQPTDSSSCRGEGQGRGSPHRHQETRQDHLSTSHPSESSYGDVCGAPVMCEECVCVCVCALSSYRKPCHAPSTKHILSTKTVLVCMCLYSARNVFKTIIGCECYPLLVLRLPNDFLFTSEPKVARWDPLHQYWTTNSVLGVDMNMGGWGWGWGGHQHGCGGCGGGVDVNMGGWSGSPVVHEVEVQCK